MSKEFRVTSAGASAAEDRAHRMRMYFVAMTLRVLCVVSLFWVQGWWIVIPVIGSVVFPWFAVMVGNAVAQNTRDEFDAPEPLELIASESPETQTEPQLIVLDVEPTRRSAQPNGARAAGAGFTETQPTGTEPNGVRRESNRPDDQPDDRPNDQAGATA